MKIVLLKDVPKIGRRGEIKEVADGFAKNMLIRKGLAQLATADVQAKIARENKEQSEHKAKELKLAQNHKTELERRIFTVKVKTGEKGQVFGGVHEKDIAASIFQKTKISLDKEQIQVPHGIKTLGEHLVTIKLGQGIKAQTKINLESIYP